LLVGKPITFLTLDGNEMPPRQCQIDQQNVLIFIPTSSTTARKLVAVHSIRADLKEYLWTRYPQASNILYLPQTFSAIIKSVIQNSSSGHIYYEII
jgi:hypothetical protein